MPTTAVPCCQGQLWKHPRAWTSYLGWDSRGLGRESRDDTSSVVLRPWQAPHAQGPGAGTPQSWRPRLFLPELAVPASLLECTGKDVSLLFQPHKTPSLPIHGPLSLHAAWALPHLLPG